MSGTAHLTDTEVLSMLAGELGRLSSETIASLDAVEREINIQTQWLEERAQYWNRQVNQYQREANTARQQLYRCESSRRDDDQYGSSCEGERRALHFAQQNLSNAQQELNNVHHWIIAVNQASEAYRAQARYYRSISSDVIPKGKTLLSNKQEAIGKYTSVGGGATNFTQEVFSNAGQKGSEFEQWASEHVFKGAARRLIVKVEDNLHLDKYGDGIGLTHERRSDAFIDQDGSIWELKAGYDRGGINEDQLREYSLMEDAGHVYIREGDSVSKADVTSINYLFQTELSAKANSKVLEGYATVWFVDPEGIVRLFE